MKKKKLKFKLATLPLCQFGSAAVHVLKVAVHNGDAVACGIIYCTHIHDVILTPYTVPTDYNLRRMRYGKT